MNWRRWLQAPLVLRSVIDLSNPKTRLRRAMLSLALAATWRDQVEPEGTALEFYFLGDVPAALLRLWTEIGVKSHSLDQPHPLSTRSPTYNKLLALRPSAGFRRVLLVDNDVVFTGPIGGLTSIPHRQVAASVADKERVPAELRDQIRRGTGLALVDRQWLPWKEAVDARLELRPANRVSGLYFNSGVVLLPLGRGFAKQWEEVTARLSDYLLNRGLRDREDVGSDQMSLSLTARRWKQVAELPLGYHYKVFNFWNGDLDIERISILHLVAIGRYHKQVEPARQSDIGEMLRRYWSDFILEGDKLVDASARGVALAAEQRVLRAVDALDTESVRAALNDLAAPG